MEYSSISDDVMWNMALLDDMEYSSISDDVIWTIASLQLSLPVCRAAVVIGKLTMNLEPVLLYLVCIAGTSLTRNGSNSGRNMLALTRGTPVVLETKPPSRAPLTMDPFSRV